MGGVKSCAERKSRSPSAFPSIDLDRNGCFILASLSKGDTGIRDRRFQSSQRRQEDRSDRSPMENIGRPRSVIAFRLGSPSDYQRMPKDGRSGKSLDCATPTSGRVPIEGKSDALRDLRITTVSTSKEVGFRNLWLVNGKPPTGLCPTFSTTSLDA